MAIRFDPDRLETVGEPIAIADGLTIRGPGRVDLAVSKTGLMVYAPGTGRSALAELVWVGRAGSIEPVDTAWRRPLIGRAALSPDGRSAAVTLVNAGVPQVWVKQLDRGPASLLTDAPSGSPAWSPDGRDLIFMRDGSVWRGPADGRVLATRQWNGVGSGGIGNSIAYSPDGKWVLATSDSGDMIGFRTEGDSSVTRLVAGRGLDRRGSVSPDGRWLAYETDETGAWEVVVRPFPATDAAKRQVSAAGGTNPRWSRDGKELFYVDGDRDLIALPVTLSPSFSTGVPRRLFSLDSAGLVSYDPTPDGSRFLAIRSIESDRWNDVIVVQNLFEELRRQFRH
jgi:serine/threonine-protein kinase